MIKGSPNLLIVGPGRGLGSSHNAIWWNLAIFLHVPAENRPSKRRLGRSLAESLSSYISCFIKMPQIEMLMSHYKILTFKFSDLRLFHTS